MNVMREIAWIPHSKRPKILFMGTPGDAQVAHDGEHIGKKRNHIETHSLCPPFFCLHRKQACASYAMRPLQAFRLEINRPIAVQYFVGAIDAMHMGNEVGTPTIGEGAWSEKVRR